MAKLQLVYEEDELAALQSGIVIECWDAVMNTGRGKRELKAAFTPEEIVKLKRYYNLYYGWNFRTGYPLQGYIFDESSDYALTQRMKREKICPMCKPHKMGWEDRRTVQQKRQDEKEKREEK